MMRFVAKALMLLFALVALAGMHQLDVAPSWLLVLPVYLVLQFLAILTHELGHALAVWKCGASLEVLSVGWWEYDFRRRRFAKARAIDHSGDLGGFVIYSFGEREPTRAQDAAIAAAGPAANIALALFAPALALALSVVQAEPSARLVEVVPSRASVGSPPPIVNLPSDAEMREIVARHAAQRHRDAVVEWLQGMTSVLAVLSLGMALTNLIPFRGSDGDQLWWALSRKRSW